MQETLRNIHYITYASDLGNSSNSTTKYLPAGLMTWALTASVTSKSIFECNLERYMDTMHKN